MALPAEIEVIELADGVRYRLPARPIGSLRYVGLVPLLFGLAFALGPLGGAAGAAADFLQAPGPGRWFGWAFVLFTVPFVVAGLTMAGLGLLILAGRSEVEVRGGRLRSSERAGPVRWTGWRPARYVRRFRVARSAGTDDGANAPAPAALAHLGLLLAESDAGRPLWLAPGYPRAWLVALAGELARRCQTTADDGSTTPAPAVEEEPEPAPPGPDGAVRKEVFERPAASNAVLEEHPDGVTITLPAAGLWRGSKGLFSFALFWCGFMVVFSALFVPALIAGQVGGDVWVAYVIIPLFWAIGLGLMLAAVHMGWRRAALAVVGGRLLALRTGGPFRARRDEWARDEVEAIEVAPSGVTVNDRPVLELQVRLKAGGKVGMLGGRDEAELHWIATRLRQALGMSSG